MRRAEEAQEKKDSPPPAPAKPTTITVDDPGLMRIKNENGTLTLDLDGERIDTASFSTDQRKRLIEMLTLIRPWLEGKPAPAPSAPVPAQQPVPSRPMITPAAPRSPVMAKEDRPSTPATSIVGQIDSVLQARIAGTPLEERGVFLTQSPEGGVMVYVGLTKYLAVEDVPDADIKAAIRAAITEWEDKYTPGLK